MANIPNALFICSKCKLPCLAVVTKWWSQKYTKESADQKKNDEFISNVTIHIVNNSWTFIKQYNQLCDQLKMYHLNFPLCDACMSIYNSMRCCQISQLTTMNLYLSKKQIRCDKTVVDQIQKEITTEQIKAQNTLKAIGLTNAHPFSEPTTKLSTNTEPSIQTVTAETAPVKSETRYKCLMLFRLFHFSYHQHYPTINGLRLSSHTPNKVDEIEIDSAFALLGQFLIELGKIFKMQLNRIRVGLFLEVFNERFIEVHYPKSKETNKFNKCIRVLFEEAKDILTSFVQESKRPIPYEINTQDKKIKSVSYLLNQSSPQNFTQAMRHLVNDFQHIQIFLLQNYINSQ